jgi:mevalonate kinase
MGYCHYGSQHFFDHAGKSSSVDAAVETVKDALAFAKGAFNLNALGQVAGLVTDSLKSIVKGDFTEEHEKAFRDRATEILKGGIEKIDDHSMDKHYLVRLKTTLPSV